MDESDTLEIVDGRHPVVEHSLPRGQFVSNDARLGPEARVMLLTGPNMAGKSTYLRQVALIVLMAQIGSFVPARSAHVGIVDRIFTRIGAHDDIAAGRSTFMVEMIEAATIVRSATARSLVVLDEVGRGTSTFDGMAIAQAIVEELHDAERPGGAPKTIFATHYHELTALADALPRLRTYRVDVLERGEDVVFLHAVVEGGADRSYGVHVARLAGVPERVTSRAAALLAQLEREQAAGRTGGDAQATAGRRRRPRGGVRGRRQPPRPPAGSPRPGASAATRHYRDQHPRHPRHGPPPRRQDRRRRGHRAPSIRRQRTGRKRTRRRRPPRPHRAPGRRR